MPRRISIVSSTLGSSTSTGWKRRSSAASRSMYLRYSSSVVAPMHLQLAARQRRLQDVRRIHGALGRARADERVQLVDEQDAVARVLDLFDDLLEALLELAAILRARDQRADVERQQPLAHQRLGHVAGRDALGQPLDDGRLADARLADQRGVVLRAAREDLDDALDLPLAADARVELVRPAPRRSDPCQAGR